MRVKVNKSDKKKEKNCKNKKLILGLIFAIIITMMFFTYQVVITFDSSHYLWLTSLLVRDEVFTNWDVARGPIFPLFIKICNKLFGQSSSGLLVGMFVFYLIMLGGCYLIYKDTIKNEKNLSKSMKMLLGILFVIMIVLNPMIFGFYHTLLTEFIAMTLAVVTCYISWKWIYIDFSSNKLKYIGYTIIVAILTPIAWFLKQPYVGTVIFPVIIASILVFIRKPSLKNILQRAITLIICAITLIISLKTWNLFIEKNDVKIKQERTSSGFLSSGIINGIIEYKAQKPKKFNTIEEIEENDKIKDDDKEEIIKVLKNDSDYKSFIVMDVKKENYKIVYTKGENISIGESIKFWIETLKENPKDIIDSYVSSYLATISMYDIEFIGTEITIKKDMNYTGTQEISAIGFRMYNDNIDNVFPVAEVYEPYVLPYRATNKPIEITNFIMEKLELPDTIIMKVVFLILPFITIISIVSVFTSRKKYQEKYKRIIDMIAILFTFSIMHILVHSLLCSTIDRYTMPALATSFMGILLSIYAIIYRKKYKIEK